MTQRAADDYVAIKQALEQIEREKAAALDSEDDGQKTLPVGNDDVGGKSFDEYLGMMIRDHSDQFNFKLDNDEHFAADCTSFSFWFPVGADVPFVLRNDTEEWETPPFTFTYDSSPI